MVKSVKFIKDWRCFKEGDEITLKPGINLLVGDQGCGKSSLLMMLQKDGWLHQDKTAIVDAPEGTTSFFLDFEKDSIRNMDANDAAHIGLPVQATILHRWMSHGESVVNVLDSMPKNKGAVMLNDEPDMALSMRSIKKLHERLVKHVTEYNQQVIVSCHNPYLMELVGEVLSLEHRNWMSFEDFKATMLDEVQ